MNHTIDTKYMLPSHYAKEYPNFVNFMNAYFKWLYRNTEYSQEEINDMANSGMEMVDIMERQGRQNPGEAAQNMAGDRSLERGFSGMIGFDGEILLAADDRPLEAERDNTEYTTAWLRDMGFPITSREPGNTRYRNIDPTRMIKLLAHLYSIRGSVKCMELFFDIFYTGGANVSFPRERIVTIDDNFILDGGGNSIRDDDYYSEYTYVISVSGEPDPNFPVFLELYKSLFHPSGFKMFIEDGFDATVINRLKLSVEGYRNAGIVTLSRRFRHSMDEGIIESIEINVDRYETLGLITIPERYRIISV
ncbi:hypothetical protein MYOV003v1_p0125 [Vibrio phage 207E48.1]|nr:hypothetical protein MYOV003v1_p0125 [Vibrio phage 207E48.1]